MINDRNLYLPVVLLLVVIVTTAGNAIGRTISIPSPTFLISPTSITNSYWPLPEGASFGYRAVLEDECEYNKLTVLPLAGFGDKYVLGIQMRVVRDQEWIAELDEEGNCDPATAELVEDTLDYYAQDDAQNIWYNGELTWAKEEEEGECSIVDDGSWEAGMPVGDPEVEPAQAGIIMLANPEPGDRYQQEYLEDEAEDWGAVLRLNASVSIELGDYAQCLETKEWTPLEPGSVEHKYYCLNPASSGLVYIRELNGKTVHVEFVGNNFPAGLPGDNHDTFPAPDLNCPP